MSIGMRQPVWKRTGLPLAATILIGSAGFHLVAEPSIAETRTPAPIPMQTNAVNLDPIAFSDIPGWTADDHLAAWKAFLASCGPVLNTSSSVPKAGGPAYKQNLLNVCTLALAQDKAGGVRTRKDARVFFETHFRPHRVAGAKDVGLLTGYYEPLLKGSRIRTAEFPVPIYRRPPDLVNMVAESERGAKSAAPTHMRKTERGIEPFPTRAEIDQGGLAGRDLELMYFKDPVDVFFMQVQGSGRVELPDGEKVRVAYDGKNGYPYTSIGRALIASREISAEVMSLQALKQWLRANVDRARAVMWKNESYVFFRELMGSDTKGPIGANNIPLQPRRSLAVDTSYYALGTPIFVESPELTHATKNGAFRRLMIAHDVGSAIKGPERGDIYFGSGDEAGRLAGVTKQKGHFVVLLPLAHPAKHQAAGGAP
ncbi:MAG: MltA domain-containing protein [Hyphomicrobium sp.]|uniref:murein transglycosylase A n=1 Tax=Hyphomicrobium sp. TaxID=82 RepID=UPI00356736F3